MVEDIRDLTIEAIIAEWEAFLQYSMHASYVQMMQEGPLFEHLVEHADDEREHAERLTRHLLSRGAPFRMPVSVDMPPQQIDGGCLDMLLADLEDEIITIDRYVEIVNRCDEIDTSEDTSYQELKILIEDIILDEIEHQDELALTIMKKTKTDMGAATPEALVLRTQEPEERKELGTTKDFEVAASRLQGRMVKVANKLDEMTLEHSASMIDEAMRSLFK